MLHVAEKPKVCSRQAQVDPGPRPRALVSHCISQLTTRLSPVRQAGQLLRTQGKPRACTTASRLPTLSPRTEIFKHFLFLFFEKKEVTKIVHRILWFLHPDFPKDNILYITLVQ